MARQGKSVAMQEQVLNLSRSGKSIRSIAVALGLSRNTVRGLLRAANAPLEEARDEPVAEESGPVNLAWLAALDVDTIVEKRRKGRTFKALYQEYGPAVSYSAFCRGLTPLLKAAPKAALRQSHKPGERTYVDYAEGICLVDPATGKQTKTQLFCGVLPFSSLTYAEFSMSQTLPSFLGSHERMWHYFGGVTPYVVVDNLKSGVTKAHRYDPDTNPTYCEFGNHYGFAVLPARPYTPRDKAAVEAAIGVIQRTFYQEVAGQVFYDLPSLNQALRRFTDRLNNDVMKDYGVSRRQRFEEERQHLLPLPSAQFQRSEWKEAKVHPDCHIQLKNNFYSAPHTLIGETLRARLTVNTVELFTNEGEAVAVHARLSGKGLYSTVDAHYPPYAKQLASFDLASCRAKAEAIGPNMAALVAAMFDVSRPLRRLRPVQGVLRLAKDGRFDLKALEYAAAQALSFRKYRVAYVTACAEHYRAHGPRPTSVAPRREAASIYLHKEAP